MRGSRWFTLVGAFTVLAAPSSARSQEQAPATGPSPALQPATFVLEPALMGGQVVRARFGRVLVRGRADTFRGDTLVLRADPFGMVRRDLALTATSRLDVRIGHASRVRGAVIGAGVGLAGGLLLGLMISDAFGGTVSEGAAISPVFFQFTVPAGIVAGVIFPGTRWAKVRVSPRP